MVKKDDFNSKSLFGNRAVDYGTEKMRKHTKYRNKSRSGTRVAWASSINKKCCGGTGVELVMQDDGNLVLYTGAKEPAWYTK